MDIIPRVIRGRPVDGITRKEVRMKMDDGNILNSATWRRVPKLAVLYLSVYLLYLELYPFSPSSGDFFLASDSEPAIYVFDEAGHL